MEVEDEMKRVVSVSLGSSKRNKRVEVELAGEKFVIERVGTDGDIRRAAEIMASLDGKVDAIGVGGTDLYLHAGDRKYPIRDAFRMIAGVKRTPVVDGSTLKNFWEREVIKRLTPRYWGKGTKVFITSGVDRNGMVLGFEELGAQVVIGDFMFALGLPIPLRSSKSLFAVARALLPVITKIPFSVLYPTGKSQDENVPKFTKFFRWADVVAGDFLYIRKHIPDGMDGKTVFTNTTTEEDRRMLAEKGVARVITTTPVIEGRSFGTNVMEGVIVALSGTYPLTPEVVKEYVERLGFEPTIIELGGERK